MNGCVSQQDEACSAEMKETFEECGFIYYLILARLNDVDPKMYQKEGLLFESRFVCEQHLVATRLTFGQTFSKHLGAGEFSI